MEPPFPPHGGFIWGCQHHDTDSSANVRHLCRFQSSTLPVLSFLAGHYNEQGSRRRFVLAVPGVWTDLGAITAVTAAQKLVPMMTTTTVIEDLRELIAALDRRVPHLEREGERAIARDAAELKAAALNRLRELERPSRRTS